MLGLSMSDRLLRILDAKPPSVEIVLTGRHADPRVVKKADW